VIRLFIVAAATVLAWPSSVSAQNQVQSEANALRLAFFSPQRAFASSSAGKAAEAKLSQLEAVRSKELASRDARLKEMQTALQKSAPVLAEPARRQRELDIERFQIDTKRFIEDAQAEFLGVQRDLENAFYTRLRPALDALARERGLLFVFNEDAGLFAWANPALDITPDIVKRLNQP
jgi:Skp family chaperone for outer membrane proteins